jgi:hypothetical protein
MLLVVVLSLLACFASGSLVAFAELRPGFICVQEFTPQGMNVSDCLWIESSDLDVVVPVTTSDTAGRYLITAIGSAPLLNVVRANSQGLSLQQSVGYTGSSDFLLLAGSFDSGTSVVGLCGGFDGLLNRPPVKLCRVDVASGQTVMMAALPPQVGDVWSWQFDVESRLLWSLHSQLGSASFLLCISNVDSSRIGCKATLPETTELVAMGDNGAVIGINSANLTQLSTSGSSVIVKTLAKLPAGGAGASAARVGDLVYMPLYSVDYSVSWAVFSLSAGQFVGRATNFTSGSFFGLQAL